MAQPVIQTSFNSGEWSPKLNARVDIAKYRGGAALLRNFFVDYRGGATRRPGTKYIASTKNTNTVRLIPFQASFTVSYILEFGNGYVRFIANGAQVLLAGVPYEIASPYAASELAQLKFAQNVAAMVICHPNYPPYQLILNSATSWTLTPITFGASVTSPGTPTITSSFAPASGNAVYAYKVTSVDINGQESAAGGPGGLAAVSDIRVTAGTNTITWVAQPNAVSYNVYRAEIGIATAIPAGSPYGYIGNSTGTSLIDSNIVPDFSLGIPIVLDPFSGSGVASITLLAAGVYTSVPSVTLTASPGTTATAAATLSCIFAGLQSAGTGYAVNDTITIFFGAGVIVRVTSIGSVFGDIATIAIANAGSINSGATPSNPCIQGSTSGTGTGATFNLLWGISSIAVTTPGTGYLLTPSVTISGGGGGSATATLGASSAGNPTVPGFFQQRLVLAGPVGNPQQFNMSQPGAYYNFNITEPTQPDNAFSGTLVAGQLNTIKSMISQPQGLVVFSDKQAWLINGGSAGSGVSAIETVANAQVFNGAANPPPLVAVDDILYVQSKGSIVRDLVFNFGKQVYTGMDISVLSSHLFYNYQILEWAWAEEPFKLVYAIRNDGVLLNLTFLKEQELVAWTHGDTNGSFKSIATVTEQVNGVSVDAVYTVVQRVANGVTVQYIERFVELSYPLGVINAWCVDCGIAYNGAPATSFTGAQHLGGSTVTGLADGVPITPFVMAASGAFTLPAAASTVVVGLAYTPQLQTLQIDTGEPTIQSKEKKIPAVTIRVSETLGLKIGQTFDVDSLVDMDDLIIGNVGKDTNALVTDLVTGDALQALDPDWNVPGQYCIQQDLPYPCSILGVIPQITVGDTKNDKQ